MRILGIETSCDETAAAVVEGLGVRGPRTRASSERGRQGLELKVLSNVVASQVKIHAKTGGVVPEVAARAHIEKIIPVVQKALRDAGVRDQVLGVSIGDSNLKPKTCNLKPSIDAIAVTAGPGLVTSLLVGVEVARTLSWLWCKPVIAVNHLAGHVYANFLPSPQPSPVEGEGESAQFPSPRGRGEGEGNVKFPALCLIVSGGHTELALMKKHLDFKIIGETRDDAAGEAFDKVAKMLNLRYPGGPEIARIAEKFTVNSSQSTVKFPRPMLDSDDFDFSFSGLKTSVLYYIKSSNHQIIKSSLPRICYEFQEAVVDVLVAKTVRAAKQYNVKTVLLGGGVAANKRLRQRLQQEVSKLEPVTCHLTPIQYTTDNAAMIAAAGCFMAQAKQYTPWQKLDVDPNWMIGAKLTPLPR